MKAAAAVKKIKMAAAIELKQFHRHRLLNMPKWSTKLQ